MDDLMDGMEAHIKGLRRYALALVGDPADADDLVQESLRRVLAYVGDRDSIENWKAYLYTTLHNVRAVHFARRAAQNQVSLDDYAEEISCPAPQHAHIEYLDLSRALMRLPVDQREIVLLIGLEGLSYREVSDLLNIPVGTVMSRLSRARAALRRSMSGLPDITEDELTVPENITIETGRA
jgi:RNA polymerase sigma-70 factor (ECF subfamily)